MKKTKKHLNIALLLFVTLLFAGCEKELNDLSGEKSQEIKISNTIEVLEDDPNLVNKVPMVMSENFKQNGHNFELLAKYDPRARRDQTAPTVSITSPANGATVSGTVNIQANASDNVGVSLVSLLVDGIAKTSTTVSPYSLVWNSATATNGNHTLTIKAGDAAGNTKSVSIQVTVNNITVGDIINPSVSISSPTNGASVTSTISITANATDNVGVSSVKMAIDGILLGTDLSSPYSFSWNTSTVAAGLHTLLATATDAAGNVNTHSISITVNTTVIVTPPTLPTNLQLAMPPVGYQGSEGNCVTFAAVYAALSSEQYYRKNATSFSQSTNIMSPEYVFNQVQSGLCSASSLLTTLDFIVSKGSCSWASMPYSYVNGCTLQPNSSQNAEAALNKIASYSSVNSSDVTAMKTLLFNKHPLIMTFGNENNFNNAGPGYIWNSKDSSNGFGSHAITICGYDNSKNAFLAINSWGTTWGSAGYIWIDYNFLPQVVTKLYFMN